MSIHLAPAALERIRGFLSADESAIGLRFGVRRTGCSGWGYLIELARGQGEGDTTFEQDGVRILVDPDSLALVDGTRIDFLKQGLNEQFVFENPNVSAECGCGESFTTDADKAELSRPA
jgi:iron-sulfur cluster assembly protein